MRNSRHATEFWRRVFRGDTPIKDDTAITANDIKNSNLIIWGDSCEQRRS
jgi:hypothetical protein